MELLPHQHLAINTAATAYGYGYFMDMGTGKTVTALAEAEMLYNGGKIDSIVVCCPKGAESVWYEHADLLLSKPAILTVHRYSMLKHLPKSSINSRTLLIGDESQFFKSHSAVVTKHMIALSKNAGYKRILSGTPITNTPFDGYSQMMFIDNSVWWRIGLRSMYDFKCFFCERDTFMEQRMKAKNKLRRAPFMAKRNAAGEVIYKNMDTYKRIINNLSITITKDEANLNLPEKTFSTITYDMTTEQRAAYDKLEEDMYLEFDENGDVVDDLAVNGSDDTTIITNDFIEADSKLVLALRLHQLITQHPQRHIAAITATNNEPAIIFARFIDEIEALSALATELKIPHSLYKGSVGRDDRAKIVKAFQSGSNDLIIANAHTAGRAITLTRARRIIYSSKSYNWEHWKQSQDRAHRIGLKHPLEVISIEAADSIDQVITKSLTNKTSIIKEIFSKHEKPKSIHNPSPNDIPQGFITACA